MTQNEKDQFTEEFVQTIDDFLVEADKLAILGVGNEDNGDDGIGLYLTKLLQESDLPKWVTIFHCERVPEHFLGKIAELAPDRIIVIDAADMKEIPGAIAIFPKEMISQGFHFSTHTLSLTMLEKFLKPIVPNLIIFYIGIQPKQIGYMTNLSEECKTATEEFAELLIMKIKQIIR